VTLAVLRTCCATGARRLCNRPMLDVSIQPRVEPRQPRAEPCTPPQPLRVQLCIELQGRVHARRRSSALKLPIEAIYTGYEFCFRTPMLLVRRPPRALEHLDAHP
jgi:hypothetical protein